MRLKWIFCLLVALFLVNGASRSRAWDAPSHMAVAGVAFDLLTESEKNKLFILLSQHRDLDRLRQGLNVDAFAPRDLAMAISTWPDLIKQDRSYRDNGYNEQGPITLVKDDRIMHKGWHFIDIPIKRGSVSVPAAPDMKSVDAVTVVNVLIKQLKSNESDAQKAFDLGWLFHLVGDLHQPLHCASGYDSTYPKGDTGGNDVLLVAPANGERELHAYWDDILGKSAGKDKSTGRVLLDKDVAIANGIINNLRAVTLPATKNDLNPDNWAKEGNAIAKKDVYKFASVQTATNRGKAAEKVTLGSTYRSTATADAQKQVKLAGYRLAQILKAVLAN